MKKYYLYLFLLILAGCRTTTAMPPSAFQHTTIPSGSFTLASWSKLTDPTAIYHFYIEGDGHAFNANGRVSNDPTPQGDTLRRLAFADPSPNVIYLARPCQYLKTSACSTQYWSTARFAPEVIESTASAIYQIAGDQPLVLIGYSGGAQVAGLVAVTHPALKVSKLITIAGNLNHPAWTSAQQLPPLTQSMSLTNYRSQYLQIPQHHYVGTQDEVVPPAITKKFIANDSLITEIPGASHGSGWDSLGMF